ncbi:HlyD family efflux transporter periplasmic adaptor subunit [Sulfurimonas sp.]|uniref:HlyD family efflux transporter periplasmic adaptor subunit n=1 Tax=Sulfurimonas sp. TaxID=2022749 RepID=UPI002AB2DFF9|nr:HlyD family efflux transporter periplasmic adaptor subunit [Sulfurimonas sp.]
MKILITLFFMFTLSFAKVYYSKVEPYELRDISSNVSGLVLFIDEDKIGRELTSKSYIRIDAELDSKELKFIDEKLQYLDEILRVNQDVLQNLDKSLNRKRENYKRIAELKFKSVVEKDREYHELVSSENAYLNTQKEIQNLNVQVADLKLRKAHLKRSVKDKNIRNKGFVLYEISVKVGQVVGISTPLAKVADTSKAKLTIYLDEVDVASVKSKVVYINGEKTSYKVSRTLNIADTKNISKYMAQIIIKAPKLFSKLATVELKDK